MNWNELMNNVSKYVSSYLKQNLSPKLLFHNINHTIEVVAASKEIGKSSNLDEQQLTTAVIAAWFHDCGYVTAYLGHEDESKRLAAHVLIGYSCSKDFIRSVLECIEATRFPQHPQSLEAKVICDADLYHFAKANYPQYEEALRLEINTYLSKEYSKDKWERANCKLLTEHTYHTEYGKNVLQRFKEINLERIEC